MKFPLLLAPWLAPPPGPFSGVALGLRAGEDLFVIAEAMVRRLRPPAEIIAALLRQADLWQQRGAAIDPMNAAENAVRRALPEFATFRIHDFIHVPDLDDPDDRQRWRRATTLARFLLEQPLSESTAAFVRAVEREISTFLEEKSTKCLTTTSS